MIPTRTQIQAQIDTIRHAPTFSTLREEVITKVGLWLDSISCPSEDKTKIMDDLESYEGF